MAKLKIDPRTESEKAADLREYNRLRIRAKRAAHPGFEKAAKKAHRQKNKEKIAAQRAAKYLLEKEKQNAISKAYYEANRGALLQKQRDRKAADPEGVKKRASEWHEKNRERRRIAARIRDALPQNQKKRAIHSKENSEKCRTYVSNRRARKRGSGGKITPADMAWLMKKQRGKCVECGIDIRKSYEADHIIPVKLGGSNHRRNHQLLCRPCNRKKWAKHPIDFAREQGRLL